MLKISKFCQNKNLKKKKEFIGSSNNYLENIKINKLVKVKSFQKISQFLKNWKSPNQIKMMIVLKIQSQWEHKHLRKVKVKVKK